MKVSRKRAYHAHHSLGYLSHMIASTPFRRRASDQRERAVQSLIGAIRHLAGARTVDAITRVVRSTARELVQADGATFVLRDQDCCHYVDEDALAPLWKGQRFPIRLCVSGWAMEHQEQVVIPDIYADPRVPHEAYRPTFVKSLVMTPVRSENSIAAIGTYWASHREPSNADLGLLQDLADTTAVSLDNVHVYADLERRVAERTSQLESRTLELVTLNKELEAFSYSVAHDLRSPLQVISGFADLGTELHGASMDPELREIMQHIVVACDGMSELITGLLDFARCTRQLLSATDVDLSALAARIAEQLFFEHAGHKPRLEIEPGLSARGDERLLCVVLTNLLSNAIKFTGKSAAAEIVVGRLEDEPVPTFFVRDNGAGFDAASSQHLFVPFQRMHSSTQFEGHGVGLATVARIVHRHGGQIWAESTPGKGATFFFSLPFEAAA